MTGTRIETMANHLRELRKEGRFKEAFEYASYLALQLIESDRIGRAHDRAIRGLLPAKTQTKIIRRFLHECGERDEFFMDERNFYLEFCCPDEEGSDDSDGDFPGAPLALQDLEEMMTCPK